MGKFGNYINKNDDGIGKTHVSTDDHIIPFKPAETNHLDEPINAGEVASIQAIASTIMIPKGYEIQGWQYDWVGQRLGFLMMCPERGSNFEERFDIESFIDRFQSELINQSKYQFVITGGFLTSEAWVEGSMRQYFIKKLTTAKDSTKKLINEDKTIEIVIPATDAIAASKLLRSKNIKFERGNSMSHPGKYLYEISVDDFKDGDEIKKMLRDKKVRILKEEK